MTYNDKKTYLEQYQSAIMKIKGLRYEKEKWEGVGVDIAQKYSDMPLCGGNTSKVERSAVGSGSILETICSEMREAEQLRDEIKTAIDSVKKPRYRQILELRYVHGMPPYKIAREWDKSERNVQKVLKCAICEMGCEK